MTLNEKVTTFHDVSISDNLKWKLSRNMRSKRFFFIVLQCEKQFPYVFYQAFMQSSHCRCCMKKTNDRYEIRLLCVSNKFMCDVAA